MVDKNLVMTFLNKEGARASLPLPAVREDLTDSEVAAAMDVVIAKIYSIHLVVIYLLNMLLRLLREMLHNWM